MKKLELYFFPECPYCQIVESALSETRLKKSVTYFDIRKDPKNRDELVKMTGRGTVPCLVIDGKPMLESKDIIAWLHQYAKEIK